MSNVLALGSGKDKGNIKRPDLKVVDYVLYAALDGNPP